MSSSSEPDVVDVVIIGAGISGIGAARALAETGRTMRILEARTRIGGTWDLFRYPGVRSDSDMATFGYTSKPWSKDRSLAPGASIRDYVEDAARETGVLPAIRFGQRVTTASWSSHEDRWTVEYEDVASGTVSTVIGRMLFAATGYYRYDRGYTPAFPGRDDFQGQLVHPQLWPADLEVAGKDVIVIGSGATAITLIPSLVGQGARVSMLQRSPTYVASVPAVDKGGARLRRLLPAKVAGSLNRWRNILRGMAVYEFSRRRPETMKKVLRKGVLKHLGPTFPIDDHFTPNYDPWDQRLCAAPNGDFFTTIASGKAQVVTDKIDTFTPNGIRLASGGTLPADIIATATGLDVLFLGGVDLIVDGEAFDPASRVSYRGMMLDGVPNFAFAIGYTNASWTMKIDLITDYFRRLLDEMDDRRATRVTPRFTGGREGLPPLIDLAAGYVSRGQHLLPRQGRSGAWRIRQNYFTDRVLFRRGTEHGAELEFDSANATVHA